MGDWEGEEGVGRRMDREKKKIRGASGRRDKDGEGYIRARGVESGREEREERGCDERRGGEEQCGYRG